MAGTEGSLHLLRRGWLWEGLWTLHKDKKYMIDRTLAFPFLPPTMFLEYLHSEQADVTGRRGTGWPVWRVQALNWPPSPHTLQHVCCGHWGPALRVLEHDEVEPRAQVGPGWGALCPRT